MMPHLGSFREDGILELGSGEGDMLAALGQRGFSHIRGTDLSPSQVAAARENGVDVELCDGRAALQAATPDSLAAVIALDVLEHLSLEETFEWLRLTWLCLRPGGLILVRVPNGEGLFAGTIRYGDITHRTAYTHASMEQLFFSQGFGTIQVRPCRPMVHGAASAIRAPSRGSSAEPVLHAIYLRWVEKALPSRTHFQPGIPSHEDSNPGLPHTRLVCR